MLTKKSLLLSLFIVTLLQLSGYDTGAAEIREERDSSIVKAIRSGGYILYIRHGEATIGQDRPDVNLNDCGTQRNLSEDGKKQAQAIGQIVSKLKIPIQYPVLASPYCRTRETAVIAFGNQNVKMIPFLADIENLRKDDVPTEEKQNIVENLTKMLEIAPPRGSNRIMVGHMFPAGAALGEIPNIGTVVIKPRGRGNGYEIVRKISLEEFMKWSSEQE
ncbi:histidine phosphatase family protein [Cohnella sp.]|uniref:histidine phosphatase family protein n=1 Tax=Cohnella sp. TaxID=1883426 RepID=UPI0035640163